MVRLDRVLPWRILRAIALGLAIPLLFLAGSLLYVTDPLWPLDGSTLEVPAASTERLRETVAFLSVELGPRWYQNVENLDRAASWIESRFAESGLEVSTQPYTLREGTYRNVIGTRRGTDPAAPVMIIGAHYDAYGETPGADDNASGVAVMLELARSLPTAPSPRTRMFVAFVNEEPPFFGTEDMGSARFVDMLIRQGVEVELMVALDLVGYFSDEPGSQRFPYFALGLVYPDEGNFIAVIGDLGSGRSVRRVKRGMRAVGTIPVRSFRGPAVIPGIDYSDHLWFRRRGLPGVLVTDTAFLRTPHYHRSSDTLETLDFRRMKAVVEALQGVLLLE